MLPVAGSQQLPSYKQLIPVVGQASVPVSVQASEIKPFCFDWELAFSNHHTSVHASNWPCVNTSIGRFLQRFQLEASWVAFNYLSSCWHRINGDDQSHCLTSRCQSNWHRVNQPLGILFPFVFILLKGFASYFTMIRLCLFSFI